MWVDDDRIEEHPLPDTKEGRCCWLRISHWPEGEKVVDYHYTRKSDGCYIIEAGEL